MNYRARILKERIGSEVCPIRMFVLVILSENPRKVDPVRDLLRIDQASWLRFLGCSSGAPWL